MPTSVYLQPALLEQLDRRAAELSVSRNRLIILAIERELQQFSDWSPGFLKQFAAPDEELVSAVDEMAEAIRKNRRSKPPVQPRSTYWIPTSSCGSCAAIGSCAST